MPEPPKATLDDVLVQLKSLGEKKKDFWDRLTPLSAFISSVVLGCAGLLLTTSYNNRQAEIAKTQADHEQEARKYQVRILEMEAVQKFMPYLTTDDERQKEVALLVITTLGSPEFATQFAKLNPSKGTQAAADRIMATVTVSSAPTASAPAGTNSTVPTPSGTGIPPTQSGASGWVYLGHFVTAEHQWETRYFDFSADAEPSTLVSTSQSVRTQTGSVNIRVGMPTDAGEFLSVRGVLRPGTAVKVRTVREWSSTGYMWAEVDYKT